MSNVGRIYKPMPFKDPRRFQASYAQRMARAERIVASRAPRIGYSSVPRTRGGAVTGEMKYFDCDFTGAISACTTTWVAGTIRDPSTTINLGDAAVANPANLCSPKVSASLNGRIGRKIKVLKIKLHGFIQVPTQATQAAADVAGFMRLMLVQDTQTNAAQMTGAQLMQDATGNNETSLSFQNPNNFGRFKVLKEKQFTVRDLNMAGSPTGADLIQNGTIYPFKISVKFRKPVTVNFNAVNGGGVADIIDNSFHVVCGANNISHAPTLYYYSRVCYKE